RLFELFAMVAVLWASRGHWYPPRGAPARQLLSLWAGYVTGSFTLLVTEYCLSAPDMPFNDLTAYPPMAVLASLLFIMLGSSYWGYCYMMGMAFVGLAFLLPFWLGAAPLLFGVAWAVSLSILSVRLRKLAENR